MDHALDLGLKECFDSLDEFERAKFLKYDFLEDFLDDFRTKILHKNWQ